MATLSAQAAGAPYPIRPLELAAGFLAGLDPAAPPPTTGVIAGNATTGGARDFAGTLRSFIASAIEGTQSYVSFSGGRDSSTVLALATDEARRSGQPDPVPVTIRVTGSRSADETEWQELVIRHLGLSDWIRIPVTDELGVLGPVATAVLARHGLLYPSNAYFHDLMAARARNGVLLAGGGGDELLEGSYAHLHARMRMGSAPFSLRTAAAIAFSVAARPLHVRVRARGVPRLRWLRPGAQAAFARHLVAPEPPPVRGWAAGVAPLVRLRAMTGLQHGQHLIAAAHDSAIVNPFLDPAVVGAAMRQGGRIGLGGRAAAIRHLTAGLLPEAVVVRQTKASFEDAMWSEPSRGRLRSGELLDVVAADPGVACFLDLDGLRAEWRSPNPHGLTALLAQAAHLASYRAPS